MAQIIVSSQELLRLVQANAHIPEQIMDLTADDEEIRFRVRTDWPILKSIRVGMRFVNFEDECMVLELATNRLTDKLSWLVDRMVEPLRLEDQGGRWEYPRLYINVNRLIGGQLRGVVVEDIAFRDGLFHITTTHNHTVAGSDSAESEDEKGTDC